MFFQNVIIIPQPMNCASATSDRQKCPMPCDDHSLYVSQSETQQPFQEKIFNVLPRIQYRQNVDGLLRYPVDDSPRCHDQFTVLSDSLILKLRDNTASARKRIKVRDRLSSSAPFVIAFRHDPASDTTLECN